MAQGFRRFGGKDDAGTKPSGSEATGNGGPIEQPPIGIGSEVETAPEIGTGETGAEFDRIEPGAAETGAPGATGPKRGRGRPKGSKNSGAGKAKTLSDTLAGIEATLIGIHYTLAQVTKCPEFAIDEDEAAAVTGAIKGVAQHYKIEELPENVLKNIAWGNLALVLFGLYSGRVYDIAKRKRGSQPGAPTGEPAGPGLQIVR